MKWNSSKPIFDSNNLRVNGILYDYIRFNGLFKWVWFLKLLESILVVKLPSNVVKLYGPHLTCKFVLAQCKLFIQLAKCLPCLSNIEEYKYIKMIKYLFYNDFSILIELSLVRLHWVNSTNPMFQIQMRAFSRQNRTLCYRREKQTVKIYKSESNNLSFLLV